MKRRTLIKLAGAMSVAGSMMLALPAQAQKQTRWDLPSAYPAYNFHSENIAKFAQDVKTATNGGLEIISHPGASLFRAPEIKRAVQGRQAQAGEIFLVNFQNEWPLFGLDGLPFLASGYEDSYKLYQAQKPFLEKKLDDLGLMLLYSVPWPSSSLYTNKSINSIEDLKGLKLRVFSPTTARIGELVGAQPVTIQEAELAQALATGVVEGLLTSSATGADNKLFERVKYFYTIQAWLPKNAVIVSKREFQALDEPTREAVLKAAAEAEARGWKESQLVDERAMEILKAGGMEIIEPSDQLRNDLSKIGEVIVSEWLVGAGDEGKAALDAYNQSR